MISAAPSKWRRELKASLSDFAVVIVMSRCGPVALNAPAAVLQAELAAGCRRAANIGMAQDHTPRARTAGLCAARTVAERDDGIAGGELANGLKIGQGHHRSVHRSS
jgi:hypothetical protein